MMQPLVSIIIPTYNRSHLISDTLDSILAQTYSNWECIVVDDGSTDGTEEVLKSYCNKDNRIQYHQRPSNRLKGANSCRNYGFTKAKGVYVNWFDSDDLMEDSFVEEKAEVFESNEDVDFVVSKCVDMHMDGRLTTIPFYEKTVKEDLTVKNFILDKAIWLTPDMMIRKEFAKKTLFNEKLMSGQEYNFYVNLLAFNKMRGAFLNRPLTKRRLHENSIQTNIHKDEYTALQEKITACIVTFKSVHEVISFEAKSFLINRMLKLVDPLCIGRKRIPYLWSFFTLYRNEKGNYRFFCLLLWSILLVLGKKSYSLKNIVHS